MKDLSIYENTEAWKPAYLGEYLNWGYWRGITPPFTAEDRVEASAALYRLAASSIGLASPDVVLEVGCGTGVGAYALRSWHGVEMHGVDVVPAQVEAARAAGTGVAFECASADALPYPDASFDVVCSVEALQHFEDVPGFVAEAFRVLRPGGRFAVTTFFPTAAVPELGELLQSYKSGFDVVTTVDDLTAALSAAGFGDVAVRSIGEYVWRQLDEWIAANGYRHHWGRNFFLAYERGLLDYHLVTARSAPRDSIRN